MGLSTAAIATLDIPLAWKRLRFDHRRDTFVTHPNLLFWIDPHVDEFSAGIRAKLGQGFTPKAAGVCKVPKANWLVRPGAILEVEDEVVYNALVGSAIPIISERLRWSRGDPVTYPLLAPSPSEPAWLGHFGPAWRSFREKSKRLAEGETEFIVKTDITAFYESIDLQRLASTLRETGVDSEITRLLMDCLHRWAGPSDRGIPQTYSASHILATLFLDSVDAALNQAGIRHLRYSDDIRLFCKDRREAKLALFDLDEILRNRGLHLNGSKTRIFPTESAADLIDGKTSAIRDLEGDLKAAAEAFMAENGPYGQSEPVGDPPDSRTNPFPAELLDPVFTRNFSDIRDSEFDEQFFRWILTELIKSRSLIAVNYSISLLAERPEETKLLVDYLRQVPLSEAEIDRVVEYLSSQEALYDYQRLQILKLLNDLKSKNTRLLEYCRGVVKRWSDPPWYLSYALAILGRGGGTADMELIESRYSQCATDQEKAGVVQGLRGMERVRRNAFYGRVEADGMLVAWAVENAKRNER